jgi:uncharacterized Zn-binding protein involved in type VI secretion
MPAVAQKGGSSSVAATDGAQGDGCAFNKSGAYAWHWNTPTTQASDAGSSNVFVNGIGVVREGDAMGSHPDGDPCVSSPVNHAPTLSTFSSNVFVNGKALGRVGDKYDSDNHYDHTITSGSSNVFAN